jgi:hypothetical protein
MIAESKPHSISKLVCLSFAKFDDALLASFEMIVVFNGIETIIVHFRLPTDVRGRGLSSTILHMHIIFTTRQAKFKHQSAFTKTCS